MNDQGITPRMAALLKTQRWSQKILNFIAVVIGAAVGTLWLGVGLGSFFVGLIIAFILSKLFSNVLMFALKTKHYGKDMKAFISEAEQATMHYRQQIAERDTGRATITITIAGRADKPIGKLGDTDIYEWIDVVDGVGQIRRFEYAGVVDMTRDYTLDNDALVFKPGVVYKETQESLDLNK